MFIYALYLQCCLQQQPVGYISNLQRLIFPQVKIMKFIYQNFLKKIHDYHRKFTMRRTLRADFMLFAAFSISSNQDYAPNKMKYITIILSLRQSQAWCNLLMISVLISISSIATVNCADEPLQEGVTCPKSSNSILGHGGKHCEVCQMIFLTRFKDIYPLFYCYYLRSFQLCKNQ